MEATLRQDRPLFTDARMDRLERLLKPLLAGDLKMLGDGRRKAFFEALASVLMLFGLTPGLLAMLFNLNPEFECGVGIVLWSALLAMQLGGCVSAVNRELRDKRAAAQ